MVVESKLLEEWVLSRKCSKVVDFPNGRTRMDKVRANCGQRVNEGVRLLQTQYIPGFFRSTEKVISKQWKKEQVRPFFGCCTADSQTGIHQLYNDGSLGTFSTAWLLA